MEPIERLFEAEGLPRFDLPAPLEQLYGGPFGLELPRLYANFVSSIDGVVALDQPHSASIISGRSQGDRFIMALLRACAGAVLIGAGTLRADPGHRWTPEHMFPDAAAGFAEMRTRLHLEPTPQLVVVSGSGDIDPAEPAVARALVITTDAGVARLRNRMPAGAMVVSMGPEVSVPAAVRSIRERGHRSILCEGGPSVMGQLLRAQLVNELFLTVSPVLAGRPGDERGPGLVDGVRLLPDHGVWGSLTSVSRHRSHLLLRYDLASGGGRR